MKVLSTHSYIPIVINMSHMGFCTVECTIALKTVICTINSDICEMKATPITDFTLSWALTRIGVNMRFTRHMLVIQPVFFFFFPKNMTFGYCFSPCGIKLATSWNGFKSSWLKGFFQIIFLAKNEGEMEFNQAIVFFPMVVCFWL